MSTQSTQPGDLESYLAALDRPSRRADAVRLIEMMQQATGEPPVLWNDRFVGFGRYSPTGQISGVDATFRVGFSLQRSDISIYLPGVYYLEVSDAAWLLLEHLGAHRMGKDSIHLRSLADVDAASLAQLIDMSVETLREHFPWP